jgi:WD40 repeat protein
VLTFIFTPISSISHRLIGVCFYEILKWKLVRPKTYEKEDKIPLGVVIGPKRRPSERFDQLTATPKSDTSRSEEDVVYDSERDENSRGRLRSTSEVRDDRDTRKRSDTVQVGFNNTITIHSSNFNHHRVQDDHLSSSNFAYLSEGRHLFSCGHWDWSVRVTSVDTGRLVQTLSEHNDVVTCMAITKDFGQRWLVTGSRDCTLIVWDISLDRFNAITVTPIRTLYGHDDTINCVAINPELDIIVSGSDDGTMMVHNLRDGKYVRSIVNNDVAPTSALGSAMKGKNRNSTDMSAGSDSFGGINTPLETTLSSGRISSTPNARSLRLSLPEPTSPSNANCFGTSTHNWKVNWVGLSKEGYIVSYSAEQQRLATFSLNGIFLTSRKSLDSIFCLTISEDGKVLLHGGSSCLIVLRWVSYLFRISLFVISSSF